MMNFALLSTVFSWLFLLAAIGAVIALVSVAKGRTRILGVLGVFCTAVAFIPGPLTGLIPGPLTGLIPGLGEVGFLISQGISRVLNLAGFVLMVLAIIVGSRGAAVEKASGNQRNPPQQDYRGTQGQGPQVFQQWGR